MKVLYISLFALTMSLSFATTEHSPEDIIQPSAQEVSQNRACFLEVSQNGCGDPGDDIGQFRSCLHNVFSTLTPRCQKMMSNLYSK